MDPLLRKVLQTLRRHNMAGPGERLLVAVSGGPDSTALLQALHELAPRWGWELHVAHLHHGLRGEAADEDAHFAEALARQRGYPFHLERIQVPEWARRRGLSLEMAAREARYAFLERVAETVGCHRIAVGHTATDQAETLLMRVLRGTDLRGLGGIPPVRGKIIRPLLDVTREEILDFLKSRGLSYRVDATNLEPHTLRTRLRLEWIPWLKAHVNPGLVKTLSREASRFREWNQWIDQQAQEVLQRARIQQTPHGMILDPQVLHLLPSPLLRGILLKAWESLGETGLQSVHLEQMEALLKAPPRGPLTLPRGIQMRYDERGVFLGRPEARHTPPSPQMLPGPGSYRLPAFGSVVEIREVAREAARESPDSQVVWVDGERLSFPLEIRPRRPGDWFCPLGLGGHRQKVKKFFIDHKIPRALRDQIPLLVAPEGIVWVMGYRLDERFRVTPQTRRVLEIRIRLGNTEKEGKNREPGP